MYKKGFENAVVDALSRATHQDTAELVATLVMQSLWLTDLQTTYLQE